MFEQIERLIKRINRENRRLLFISVLLIAFTTGCLIKATTRVPGLDEIIMLISSVLVLYSIGNLIDTNIADSTNKLRKAIAPPTETGQAIIRHTERIIELCHAFFRDPANQEEIAADHRLSSSTEATGRGKQRQPAHFVPLLNLGNGVIIGFDLLYFLRFRPLIAVRRGPRGALQLFNDQQIEQLASYLVYNCHISPHVLAAITTNDILATLWPRQYSAERGLSRQSGAANGQPAASLSWCPTNHLTGDESDPQLLSDADNPVRLT